MKKRPRVPIEVIGELRADLAALRKAGRRIRKLFYTVARNTGFDRKEYPYVAYLAHPSTGKRLAGAPNRSFAVKCYTRQPRLPRKMPNRPAAALAAPDAPRAAGDGDDAMLPVPVPAPSAQATPLGGLDTVTGA